jgi:predicted GNAT family acetyltransferase
MAEDIEVRHDAAQQRFEVLVDGVRAELDYDQRGGILSLTHTGVPTEIGGRGVGGALVRAALEYARAKGLKVKPQCEYAASYIERHPQYRDLLKA